MLLLLELDEPLPLPWENPPLPLLPVEELPLEESTEVALLDAAAEELLSDPEWLSVPGPPPERPGTVSAVFVALLPEEVAEGSTLPASISSPVAINEARTVGSLPSITVSLVPAILL